MTNPHQPRRRWLLIGSLGWMAAVAGGFSTIWNYEWKTSADAVTPSQWPAQAGIPFEPGRPNLVMIAHPHCPCTRASMEELAKITARSGERLASHILFIRPSGVSADWTNTDLWASAAAIPGADVRIDDGGRAAEHFGALTSGQVVVYDRFAHLQFAGGITAGRGHPGDNPGSSAILSVVARGTADTALTPVFGCALRNAPVECSAGSASCGS